MKTLKVFLGATLLAVTTYTMLASAQTATSDQIGPLIFACSHTVNCYTKDSDCSQGGKFMQCQCNNKTDSCYVNNSGD